VEHPIKVFPFMALPRVVFFPNTYLNLYIFEEHYKKMLKSAIENSQPVGIFLARQSGSLRRMFSSCERIGTFGEIVKFEKLPRGNSFITLYGVLRGVLTQVIRIEPFPLAQVQVCSEQIAIASGNVLENTLKEMINLIQRFEPSSERRTIPLPPKRNQEKLFLSLVNSIAAMLPADPLKKQDWLSEENVIRRYELIKDELMRLLTFNRLVELVTPLMENPELN